MSLQYPHPSTDHEFEQLCLRLYRKHWKNEALILYAKRGEKQDGIDIIDPLGRKPFKVIQCKLHETTKTLPPTEIEAEVKKAEQSQHSIDTYVIATTAKRTKNAQDKVVKLNQRPASAKKFDVELHYWDELCSFADQLGATEAVFVIYGRPFHDVFNIPISHANVHDSSAIDGPTQDDTRFANINQLFVERKFEAAEHELQKLTAGIELDELSIEEHYQVLRFQGKLALAKGDYEAAADSFLSAYEKQPVIIPAKQNQVLAYWLRNEFTVAHDLAQGYLDDGFVSEMMVTHLVRTIRSQEELDQTCQTYSDLSDEELLTATAHKYLEFGDYEKANHAALDAEKLSEDSPYVHLLLGMINHEWAIHGHWSERSKRFSLALEHYSSAIRLAESQNFKLMLPDTFMNRGALRSLMDLGGADEDFIQAVETADRPVKYAERAISYFLAKGKPAKAEKLLKYLNLEEPNGKFLAAVVNADIGNDETKRESIRTAKTLTNVEWDRAIECRFQGVQWALELNEIEVAESFITDEFVTQHPFHAHLLRGWISGKEERFDDARRHANAAEALLAEVKDEVSEQDIRLLAHMFLELGDDEQALVLLEQIVLPGLFDQNMKDLIECAQRLERHDLMLRLCRELRESGVSDDQLQKLEVDLLSLYSPAQAVELIDQFLNDEQVDHKYFRAFRNNLAVRLNRHELFELAPDNLPGPSDLSPDRARLVIAPYLASGHFDEALIFLYGQLRMHFDDSAAHRNYVSVIFSREDQFTLLGPPTQVVEGAAVLLQQAGRDSFWVVFENDFPQSSRSEFDTNSQLFETLHGCSIGDSVKLPGAMIGEEIVEVVEIQSKYVRVLQDSMTHFRHRFPDEHFLQQIQFGSDESPDFSEMFEILKQREATLQEFRRIYATHPVSICLLADRIGCDEFDATVSLTTETPSIVRCCRTSPTEFERLAEKGFNSEVVLDLSAIISISLVDGWSHLDRTTPWIVSQTTKELIDFWVRERLDSRFANSEKDVYTNSDEHRLDITTIDARTDCIQTLQKAQSWIEEFCTIKSSMRIAELAPEFRRNLVELIGHHHLESICCAVDANCTFWSDDYVTSMLATVEFGTEVIWSQLAFYSLLSVDSADAPLYHLISAKLLAMNYVTTVWKAETLIQAGESASWNISKWPFNDALTAAARAETPSSVRGKILADFLKILRRSTCSEISQTSVIQSCLDAFDDPLAVRWTRKHLTAIFGVDVVSERFVRLELDYWLRLRA